MAVFALSKWYFDLVASDGETAIVYAAKLRVAGLEIHYASLLHASPEGRVRTRTALEAVAPELSESRIRMVSENLDLSGIWRPLDPPIEDELLTLPSGSLRWHCLAPRARATLSIDGRSFDGLGYAEKLELGIPPWDLPIQTLYWGRALTEREGITWIDWRGPHSVQRVYRGGKALTLERIDNDALEATDTKLVFRENSVMRQGTIGSTALRVLGPKLRGRVPASALLLDERKWRARIELDGVPGFAIHEVVTWP